MKKFLIAIAVLSSSAFALTKEEALNTLKQVDMTTEEGRAEAQQILKDLIAEHKELFDKNSCLTSTEKDGSESRTYKLCLKK